MICKISSINQSTTSNTMQLRNGKKTDVGNEILKNFAQAYGDIVHVYVWCNGYETVMLPRIRNDFQYIHP